MSSDNDVWEPSPAIVCLFINHSDKNHHNFNKYYLIIITEYYLTHKLKPPSLSEVASTNGLNNQPYIPSNNLIVRTTN